MNLDFWPFGGGSVNGRLLATSTQVGYTLRIYVGAGGWPIAVGTCEIESPTGERAKGGYWMDWPEKREGWPSEEEYLKLPMETRAQLEANQQLLYGGLAHDFQIHKRANARGL